MPGLGAGIFCFASLTKQKKERGHMKALIAFFKDERGTETLEWGLVCGLIVLGAIVALASIGPKVTGMWNNLDAAIK